MPTKPTHTVATITDITVLPSAGPWPTKSDGLLTVLFGLDFTTLTTKYLHYQKAELKAIGRDVRGLRSYSVKKLKNKTIGAQEWHRIRNELVFVVRGCIKWTCEDVYGQQQQYTIDQTTGVWTPPFILHTYEALQDDTEILVVANTLFFPDDASTYDTYSAIDFKLLQAQYTNS